MDVGGHVGGTPGTARRELTEKEHQKAWLTTGGNLNQSLASSSSSSSKNSEDKLVPDIELKRYELDEKHLTGNDSVNKMYRELVNLFNATADARCQVIRTRCFNYNRAKLSKMMMKCRKKVDECTMLRKSLRDAGGPYIPIPDHFKADP